MSIRCSDILKLPALKNLEVVGGAAGLNRRIRWVYFGDGVEHLSDSVQFINGYELFVITGKSLNNTQELVEILPALDQMNIAGILINVGPYFSDFSAELVAVADKLCLPLFRLPWEVKLVNITQAICNAIICNEIDESKAASLLEVLLFSNNKSAEELLQILINTNIDHENGCRVGLCSMINLEILLDQPDDQRKIQEIRNTLLRNINDALAQYGSYIPAMPYQDGAVFLIPDNPRSLSYLSALFQGIESDLIRAYPALKLRTGIGGSYRNPLDFRKSLAEARQALVAAQVQAVDTHLIAHEDLGLYALLLNINDPHVLEDFYQTTWGKLAEYDKINNTELCLTLNTFYTNNADLQNTAAVLYIHKNTLKYRLDRINSLLGCDIRDTEVFLRYGIGLKVGKILAAKSNRT